MMANDVEARLDVIAQIEKQLIEIVQDDSREAKAIDVVGQMKVAVQKQHDDYSVIQSDFLKISADYNADVQQYNALDKNVDAFWRSTMKQQVDLRFSLREQLTRDEWKKLYKEIN
jgi:septal ring factor EnvC (AmiA/AmiB activator)